MRLESWSADELRRLGVTYAIVTVLRMIWGALLAPVYGALAYILPNPLGLFGVFDWLRELFGALLGRWGVNGLVDYPLLVSQTVLIVLVARTLLFALRPDVAAKLPTLSRRSMDGTGDIDGGGLRRPWWIVPAYMAFGTFYTVSFLFALIGMLGGRGLYGGLSAGGPWPLWLALALMALGLLWGHRFNRSARGTVAAMFGVTPLADDHWLTQRVHKLAARLDLPPPAVGVVGEVNAFAVGSNPKDAMVVLGAPLVKQLTAEQLDAVIGHELGHVVSSDMRQMQYAVGYQRMFSDLFAVIASFTTQLAGAFTKTRTGAVLAQSPGDLGQELGGAVLFVGGELLSKGLSRRREFHADAIGAGLTSPEAMAGALDRIAEIRTNPTPAENRYAYLMFRGGEGRFRPFATHPSMQQRKQALATRAYVRRLPRKVSL